MTSFLPEDLEEDTIALMSPGDQGYTLPWAMWADSHRQLWINGKYPVQDKPSPAGQTCHMHIKMLKNRTVEVDRSTIGNHKYEPHDSTWIEWSLPVILK